MSNMDQQELKTILDLHRKWVMGEDGGIQANFDGADLYGANFDGADLREAILVRANLRVANLYGANLYGADLRGAILVRANLRVANLYGSNFDGADLREAILYGANLYGANLKGANLRVANLYGANLYGADLRGANLEGADLEGADLRGSNLYRANLYLADLDGADLRGANLEEADLDPIKADYFAVLGAAKDEVSGVYKALLDGKINGRLYEGDCACLIGTIAKLKGCNYRDIPGIRPEADRAAERWFTGIRAGDTPDNNPVSKITRYWTEEFAAKHGIRLPKRRIVWEEEH